MIFFLLYFSPIFFFKKSHPELSHLFALEFSPQKSLIIPLILTYIGIYVLAFTFSGTLFESIHIHMSILLVIFLGLLGYILAFNYRNEVFFDIFGFHLFFSAVTLILVSVVYFFMRPELSLLDFTFSVVTLAFSVFFFLQKKTPRHEFVYSFLISIIAGISIICLFFWPTMPVFLFFGILLLFAI